jgi:D-alanyl-D-alanine carboxypeptidase
LLLQEAQAKVSASGMLVMDLESGQQLLGRLVDERRPIASLTKLMTALIIVEHHSMDEWVTIPVAAAEIGGNRAYLEAGQHYRVGDLLSALLILSANDAAVTLALYHSGSVESFVDAMNVRTQELGMSNTSYANPTGFDDPVQYSTPRDLAWLTMFAFREPEIHRRMGMRGTTIVSREGVSTTLTHTHALLHADTPVVAGKTGTTDGAGQCLLSVLSEQGRSMLVILLHSSQRYTDMRVLLDALAS